MRKTIHYISSILLLLTLFSCSTPKKVAIKKYTAKRFVETGIASWYGPNFNGKPTANGETYDMYKLTAAHRTLPFNSLIKVVNKNNNKSVVVRINDRGPYAKNRIIDLSKEAAKKINMIKTGTTNVDLFLLNNKKIPRNVKLLQYTIQIGSYSNKNDALKVSWEIADSRIVKVILKRKVYYRIYVGLYNNKNKAEKHKKLLKKKGIIGFIKQVII